MRDRIHRAAAMLAAICVSAVFFDDAHADVYRYVDAQGIVHFSNVPTDSRYTLAFREDVGAWADGRTIQAGPRVVAPDARYGRALARVARTENIDAALLRAVIHVESAYDPRAVSPKGAVGLMQLMPATAKRYGVSDPFNPMANIRAGARYLHDLMKRFDGDLSLALAAYNAGEGAVVSHGNRIPPYRETRAFVSHVLKLYRRARREQP